MNIWDIIITFMIAALIIFALALIIHGRKKGTGCHHDCSKCDFCAYK